MGDVTAPPGGAVPPSTPDPDAPVPDPNAPDPDAPDASVPDPDWFEGFDHLSAEEPAQDRGWIVLAGVVAAVVVVVAVVARLLGGGGGGTDSGPDAPPEAVFGGDVDTRSVLEEEPPSLDELTADITVPPGPEQGLLLADRGVTVVEDRFEPRRREITYAAVLDNDHPDWIAHGVQVTADFVDEGGAVVASDSAFLSIVLPDAEVAVAGLVFVDPGDGTRADEVVDVTVIVDVAYWEQVQPVEGGFTFTEVETGAADYSGVRTTFLIENRYDTTLRDVAVTAVYRDEEGRILGGYDTFLDRLRAGEQVEASVDLLVNIDPEDIATTELFATPDVAGFARASG